MAFSRSSSKIKKPMPEYDVVVVGAGVNGTGIARDLAIRGLKVCLVEKSDFAAGASGANTGMIHGGLRYLIYDIDTTKHSCLDSGYIQKIVPFLLFRIPFIMPLTMKATLPFFETYFEVYDKYASFKRGMPHTMLGQKDIKQLVPNISDEVKYAVTTDEWGIDPQRLCVLNGLSAASCGANIKLHTEVTDFLKDASGNIIGVRVRDKAGYQDLPSRMVMQATGPWIMRTSRKAGVEVKIRPGKGVHITFDRRLLHYSLIINMVDGRMGFIMPHENATILGTTDDDFYGDPDDLRVSEDEVDYLISGAARYLPDIKKARMVRAWAGIRPTLFAWGRNEDALSRDHKVFDHEKIEGVKGIVSIAGGKLASYRLMSEEAADLIAKKLGSSAKCQTHLIPLPGGEKEVSEKELAEKYGVPQYAVHRMVYRHGAKAIEILELTRERPELKETVCRCEPVIAAELVYCIRNEWAATLTDLRNRTRLGTGTCQGMRCGFKAAAILAGELDMSGKDAAASLLGFLERRWKGNRPVLRGRTLEEEELNQAAYFLVGNLNRLLTGK